MSSTNYVVTLLIMFNLVSFTCVSSSKVTGPPKGRTVPSSPATIVPEKCPKDTLKFGVCGSWLGLVTEVIGTKPSKECCALIKGLADLEAALCLCTAVKANVLGVVKVNAPIWLSLLVNACGKKVPDGFVCA